MGFPHPAEAVKLFVGIMFADGEIYRIVRKMLESEFGSIDHESEIFNFNFTDYYRPEMGEKLCKQFLSFEKLIQPEHLIDIKLRTNEIEGQFAQHAHRRINIDPGYLSSANVILATTKNFSHRLYLGKGIYGDIHLRFIHGEFRPLEWTYADYQQPLALDFFVDIKRLYMGSKKTSRNKEDM